MAQISEQDIKALVKVLETMDDGYELSLSMIQGGWNVLLTVDGDEVPVGGTAGSIADALDDHPIDDSDDRLPATDLDGCAFQPQADEQSDDALQSIEPVTDEAEQIEQVLQTIDLSPIAADQGDANDDDEDEKSLGELIEMWQHKNNAWRTEGDPGVENLEKLVQTLGYDGHIFRFGTPIEAFLSDNPGCIEAIVNWISEEARVPEWTETMVEVLGGNAEGDDDEGDDR
jgi:hypothetical protein